MRKSVLRDFKERTVIDMVDEKKNTGYELCMLFQQGVLS